jgi:hypothetical protein
MLRRYPTAVPPLTILLDVWYPKKPLPSVDCRVPIPFLRGERNEQFKCFRYLLAGGITLSDKEPGGARSPFLTAISFD